MDDAPAYLQPDFNPATLRVAELRGILVEHDVDYPSTAKKAELIELFNEYIQPRTRRLLGARSRVKASSRGIVNAEDDEAQEEAVVVQATPRKSTRASSRRSIAPSESENERATREHSIASTVSRTPGRPRASMGPPPSTARRTSDRALRTSVSREPESMDERVEEETPKPAPRRTTTKRKPRKSLSELLESGNAGSLGGSDDEDEEEVFTKANPFQAGSPPPTVKSPDGSSRRRTLMDVSPVKRTPATATRKSLPANAFASPAPETRRTTRQVFNVPLSSVQDDDRAIKEEVDDDGNLPITPGEEFVPEEEAELVAEERDYAASTRRSTGNAARSLFAFVILSVATAFFLWWRKEKISVGFCGVGGYDGPTGEVTIQNFYIPRCEPCPPHSTCLPELKIYCHDDYVRVPNPYELWGLIPLPPTCEPDSEKLRRVAILSEEAVRVLRSRVADVECGKVKLKNGEPAGLSEEELKRRLYEIKNPKLSDELFNELWRNALEDVQSRDEIVIEEMEVPMHAGTEGEENKDSDGASDGDSPTPVTTPTSTRTITVYRSTSHASLPILCSLRRSFLATLNAYKLPLLTLLTLLLTIHRLKTRLNERKALRAEAAKHAHVVFTRLANQRRRHESEPEKWNIAIIHLRDQVLQYEFNHARRAKVWDEVIKIVELNSNVRPVMRFIEGESMRCWCWTGSLADMEVNPGASTGSGGGAGGGFSGEGALEGMGVGRVRRDEAGLGEVRFERVSEEWRRPIA